MSPIVCGEDVYTTLTPEYPSGRDAGVTTRWLMNQSSSLSTMSKVSIRDFE